MSDEPDNLVLARLREIRDMLGRVLEDTTDLRLRVGALEAQFASVSLRVDRLDSRLERIERRLNLVDAP
jgi:chromosome segregation ATPase